MVHPVSSFCLGLIRWSLDAWSFSRLGWVEVFGLPPLAWSSTNLISIGKIWGKVRGFDERTVKGFSFGSTSMLIQTCLKDPMYGHVELVLGDHRLSLRVTEISMCPSKPCSLASVVEATIMAIFPSLGSVEGLSKAPMLQSHEEDGRAIISSISCGIVINDWGQF